MGIKELTKEYTVIGEEEIWFDEPFKRIPSKEDFEQWLDNIRKILEISIVIKNW